MTRLRLVAQSKLDGRDTWNDEFWSYNPAVFRKAFEEEKRKEYLNLRAVLRIIEEKTFKQIQLEQGK